jgi:hypothetical protein
MPGSVASLSAMMASSTYQFSAEVVGWPDYHTTARASTRTHSPPAREWPHGAHASDVVGLTIE